MSSAQKLERRLPMPTAIVAGGAGFLGSHLCEKLLDNQVEVVCVDNFSTGKKSHLFRCLKSPHFHLLTLDAHGLSANRILRAHYIFDIIDTQDRQPSNNDLDTLLDGTTITKRLLEVAQKFSAKFLLASTSSAASIEESIATEYHRNHNLDTRIVRLTDVYGPRMDISAQLPLPRLINQIHHHQQLEIEGKGSRQLSPVYVDDAVEGIMKAMFSPGTTGEIFTLSSQTVSQLDVARMLQKLSPFHPQINSIPTNAVFTSPPPPQPRIPWKPTVSLETGLRFTLDSLDQAPTRLQPFRPVHPKPNRTLKPSRRFSFSRLQIIIIGIITCILIIVSPFVVLAGTTALGLSHLQKTPAAIYAGHLDKGLKEAQVASSYFSQAQSQLTYIGVITSNVGLSNVTYRLEKLLELGSNLANTSIHLLKASEKIISASRIIFGQEIGDPIAPLSEAQAETTRAYELLSIASAEVAASRPNLKQIQVGSIGASYAKLESLLPKFQHQVATTRALLSIAPNLIGASGEKKTYLLLLQNNAELRPTGGFIGSFALITFDKGKLLDFLVEDVYTADGQLKGHVEPPLPIKKYLGEAGWYLRDVNWDPDFPATARQAEWFLQKELDKEVDGTIAINLYVAQHLLEAMGPLTLSDYNETITAQNLFERAEYYSEINFFPGSTQKKDFLAALARGMYSKLQSISGGEFLSIARALDQSLRERQLLFSPKDASLSSIFTANNWTGEIVSPACNPQPCLTDYWNLTEANVGVNKANYFVKRQLSHRVTILKENHLRATTTATYTNTSAAQSWPAGDYKNYLRLYTPLGSELESINIDGKKLAQSAIEITREHSKTVFGFLVTVPIKTTTIATITYTLPGKLTFPGENPLASYTGVFQKQSGVGKDPFTIEIAYPTYMKPVTVPAGSVVSDQTVILSTTTLEDTKINLQFVK